MYVGFSRVDSATVFKVSLTSIDQEGVVSGHLIGRTSPGGLMNIYEAKVTTELLLPRAIELIAEKADSWSDTHTNHCSRITACSLPLSKGAKLHTPPSPVF